MEFCASNGRLQPGFRFHPTNVELVMYYLKKKVLGKVLRQEMITEVDVYKFHPKDLRELACLKKDLNWYFFCPRGKKYGCGERTNRATHSGYWKATGNDRVVSYEERTVGKIKTLVFHEGKPPKGTRTDWVMHEYKLEDKKLADEGLCQDSYVLCKIFKKSGWGPKNAEQYGAPFIEEEWDDDDEILDGAQVVNTGDHNQCTSVVTDSAVTNVLVSVNAYPAYSSGQGYSGAISAGVDEAPTSIANAAAVNIASSSMGLIPTDYAMDQMLTPVSVAGNLISSPMGLIPTNYAMDQMLTPVSVEGNLISSPMGPFPNYNVPVVEGSTSMPMAAGIASTSTDPLPTNEDDEMDRLLDMFVVGDERDVYGGLEDLDQMTAQGIESGWTNFDEGGFYLSELDEPLLRPY